MYRMHNSDDMYGICISSSSSCPSIFHTSTCLLLQIYRITYTHVYIHTCIEGHKLVDGTIPRMMPHTWWQHTTHDASTGLELHAGKHACWPLYHCIIIDVYWISISSSQFICVCMCMCMCMCACDHLYMIIYVY